MAPAAAQPAQWALVDHVCRVCFGRVLVTHTEAGNAYRCSNCGLEVAGRLPAVICACGMKLKTGKDGGLRCIRNTDISPEFPSEVVAGPSE